MSMSKKSIYQSFTKRAVSLSAAALLLVTPLAVFSASADSSAAYTTLSSFSGMPDSTITVSGGNYGANETVSVTASENGSLIASATTTSDANGQYSTGLTLPVKLTQGSATITATGTTSGLTSTNGYYITPFNPSLSATGTAVPYSVIDVSGTGYAPNEAVDLNFAGATTTVTADATGAFTDASVTTPKVPAASYTIIGAGEASGASATAYEYVNGFYPSASPSSYYVLPATSLGFNGSGFADNELVNVTDATTGSAISSFTTDATGAFSDAGTFNVPTSDAGLSETYVLTGTVSGASTSVSTTIGQYFPNVSPTAYYILPGSTLSFNGSGFVPGETVNITTGTTALGSVTADSFGDLTAAGSVVIPTTAAGTTATYTLTGESSHGTGTVGVQIGNYNAQANPSTYYVMPGGVITFSGSGYAPDDIVAVFSGLNQVGIINADATGAFTAQGSVQVAYNKANTSQNYSLVGTNTNSTIAFSIGVGQLNTQLSPSNYYVLPYAPFTASATGFVPGETVTVTNGATVLGSATADSFGTAAIPAFSLPPSTTGSATLTATGTTSGAVTTTTVGIGNYNPTVTADNYYTKPGTTINLTGSGFAPGEAVTVTAGDPAINSNSQTVTADAMGNITAAVTIPLGTTTKDNNFTITSTGVMSTAVATTAVTLAPYNVSVSPSTYYATPGSPVSFTGSGFAPGETVDITLNGTKGALTTADAMGNFTSGTFTLPFATSAVFTVNGENSFATQTITVGLAQFYAGLQLSSYYGNGGSVINAIGSGYAPGETITITGGTTTVTTTANAMGNFTQAVTVPYAAAGTVDITATGALSGAAPTTGYTTAQVYNSVGLGSYAVPAGTALNITGTGFFPNEPVTVTNDRDGSVYHFTADADGSLNDSSDVLPASYAAGNLTITINGTESFTSSAITLYVQPAVQ